MNAAVRSDTEGSYVYEKDGDGVKKTYITTGITTDKEVEVLDETERGAGGFGHTGRG